VSWPTYPHRSVIERFRPIAAPALAALRGIAERSSRKTTLALVVVALAYASLALSRPSDAFWSPNSGSKLLQVLALLEGRLDLSLGYPGRWLDPELIFRPYTLSYVVNGGIQVPWPMAWALPSALLYAVFGGPGLMLLPVAGGVLAAWSAGGLAERITPGSGWLAVLLAGLATPMFIFSTVFWEHAPAAGLFALGFLLLLGDAQSLRRTGLVLAGCCFGLAVAWRNETAIYVLAAVLAASRMWESPTARWRRLIWPLSGMIAVLVPTFAYNWLVLGAVTAARMPPFTGSIERAFQNLLLYSLALPADFLVGTRDGSAQLPELIRWAPAVGLALLVTALLATQRWRRPLQLIGLLLVGSATTALLIAPVPPVVSGFLVAAPFLALILVAPKVVWAEATGRTLLAFTATALSLYIVLAVVLHVRGVGGSGSQWGPRFLLPVYPVLAAVAAAKLRGFVERQALVQQPLARALVALGVTFQLAGLARIEGVLERVQEQGRFIASLPPGAVVIRANYLIESTAGLTRHRSVFCAQTPLALRRWSELALVAGQREFWFVDREPLPTNWLSHEVRPIETLSGPSAASLQAARYDTNRLHLALQRLGRARESCQRATGT
jgi:hypothetical protein